MTEIVERVRVRAPVERTWATLTDWTRQGEWMLATSVRVSAGDGAGEGSRLVAITGAGPLAFADPMEITGWEPPRRCEVQHTGTLVRGIGVFEVRPRGTAESELVWTERLELPFGMLGRAGWLLTGPAFRAGLRYSLRRFAVCAERPA